MFQSEFLLKFLQHLPQGDQNQTTTTTTTSSCSDIRVCEEGIISAKKIVSLARRGAESPPSFNSEASCISNNSCCTKYTSNPHQHHFLNKDRMMSAAIDGGGGDIRLLSADVSRHRPSFLLQPSDNISFNPMKKRKGALNDSHHLHRNVDFHDVHTWGADHMSQSLDHISQRVDHSLIFNPAVNAGQYISSPNTNRFTHDHINVNINNMNECPIISTTMPLSSNNMNESQTWVKQEAQEALSVNTWLQSYLLHETPSWGELQPSFSLVHSASNHRTGEEKPLSKEVGETIWRHAKVPHEVPPLKRSSHSIAYKPQAKKERIADRIPVLQQLVSPFGKTDTASVLHETINYIKFLHDQVEMLSTPYCKFGRSTMTANEPNKMTWGSNISGEENEEGEPTEGLSGRGLCVVPLSSILHLANSQPIADYWTSALGGRFNQ